MIKELRIPIVIFEELQIIPPLNNLIAKKNLLFLEIVQNCMKIKETKLEERKI